MYTSKEVVACFEIEENLEKKSNSLGLARCIIYVRYVNGSKIKICQLVNKERPKTSSLGFNGLLGNKN